MVGREGSRARVEAKTPVKGLFAKCRRKTMAAWARKVAVTMGRRG